MTDAQRLNLTKAALRHHEIIEIEEGGGKLSPHPLTQKKSSAYGKCQVSRHCGVTAF